VTDTTTISLRISDDKKDEFDKVLEQLGISRQKALEGFVDRIIEQEDQLLEEVQTVEEQVLEVALREGGGRS